MASHLPHLLLNTVQTILGIAVLVLLIRTRELKSYWPLLTMALFQAPAYFVLLYVRYEGHAGISPMRAYHLYFNSFWVAFAISVICSLLFPYVLFRNAMRPLKGLQSLGNIVFAWVASISVVVACSVALGSAHDGKDQLIEVVSQMERLSAILLVSMVAFVAIAIRPMGLSVHSRVFGSSIGTLILALTNLVDSTAMNKRHVIYDPYALVQMASSCVALCIWIYYFAMPEPQRKFILLPTTSPFHHWNRISEMLGHEPGFVAIGGVAPEAFAVAEVEIFRRASVNIRAVESQRGQADLPPGGPKAVPPRLSKR